MMARKLRPTTQAHQGAKTAF